MRVGIAMQAGKKVPAKRGPAAFTLIEVAVATAIAAIVMAGMFKGYTLASRRAQYSSYSLAATATAMKEMERIVAATWCITGTPSSNIFNPALTVPQTNALCLPSSGTNIVYATNYATVTQLSATPPYAMVKVQCVWNFMGLGNYTNTVAVIRGPDL